MATPSEHSEQSTSDRWKTRYLGAVEAQERVERQAGTRVGELGSLVVRLSRALPSAQADVLGKRLGTLTGALKRRPLDPDLSRDMRELKDHLLDVMESGEHERAALHGALADATRSLEGLCTSRDFKRRLKSFRRSLSRREPPLPSELVQALKELQDIALEEPGARGEVALNPPPEREIRVMPSPEVGTLGSKTGSASAASRESVADIAQMPAGGSIDWSAVREVLRELVARIDVAEELRSRLQRVTGRLEQELGEENLIQVLESIRDLMDAVLMGMTLEFQGFLDSVDQRLDLLLGTLGNAREEGRAALVQERRLTDSFQASIEAMRTEAAAATRLEELKTSIDGHLVTLVESVGTFGKDGDTRGAARDASLAALEQRLRELESESRDARGQLEEQRKLARTDALTGLPNRKAMDERLVRELEDARASGTQLAVAIADIDHFKRVNDRFGHQAGDRALVLFAGILARRIRRTDFCARFGGEEFLLLFPSTDVGTAVTVLEQIRVFVESCGFSYKGEPVPLTASFGVTGLSSGDSASDVLERADRALYTAKEGGRNRVSMKI